MHIIRALDGHLNIPTIRIHSTPTNRPRLEGTPRGVLTLMERLRLRLRLRFCAVALPEQRLGHEDFVLFRVCIHFGLGVFLCGFEWDWC